MKCALCGHEFDETQAQAACAGCILAQGCKRVRCPNCGYETLPEPAWLRKLFDRRKRDDVDRKG
jgi:rubredoxin